jgi:hypothetical protein
MPPDSPEFHSAPQHQKYTLSMICTARPISFDAGLGAALNMHNHQTTCRAVADAPQATPRQPAKAGPPEMAPTNVLSTK